MFQFSVDDEITLGLLEDRHAVELLALIDASRAELCQWLTWVDVTHTVDDVRRFVHLGLQQFAAAKGVQAAIRFRGNIAGVIGHRKLDWVHKKNELGFWVGTPFLGQGIGTRAVRGMLGYAFDELALHRSTLRVPAEHSRALLLAERVGFVREGVIRKTNWLNGRWVDHVLYGMLAEEWTALHGAPNSPAP